MFSEVMAMKVFPVSALCVGAILMGAQAETAGDKSANAAEPKTAEQVFHGETLDRSVQVYPKASLQTWNRKKAAGGEGDLLGEFAYTRMQTDEKDALREIGWTTLPPGASIGLHQHKDNEDAYIIIAGTGVFTDSNGKETVVGAGDVTIARPGQSHALRNNGNEPLVFLDVIAQTTLPPATNESDTAEKK
ncbi:cupin domain-containing protein [uncultured Cardiobacterium sp.]|uniref:cupin domain-containing protein n=1 Tax=uncultured Cardiobacterium sp. TaxID=417619 RepID=UPI002622A827|nr:cupin domain-containing protein [uncultured Cardiobacterium sp.]